MEKLYFDKRNWYNLEIFGLVQGFLRNGERRMMGRREVRKRRGEGR